MRAASAAAVNLPLSWGWYRGSRALVGECRRWHRIIAEVVRPRAKPPEYALVHRGLPVRGASVSGFPRGVPSVSEVPRAPSSDRARDSKFAEHARLTRPTAQRVEYFPA